MESVSPIILSVGQLNTIIKSSIDNDYRLQNIFLCGEISNFKHHRPSGHFYMTLKDDKSAVKAVMFRTYSGRLKFMPEDGMRVIVFGSVSVFERDGQYQFYIENMQPDGLGSLSLAFEQLKEKLGKEGLFSEDHKKSIPKYPNVIGVVTSPTAAAFQDIQNVLSRRWPRAEILLSPTQVQGESAPAQIVSAIRALDASQRADVILLARGGGSIEDLWAFNEERVARAIYACKTPLISGVGHETDFTIADFVADLRAPTPSAAAEIATPDRMAEQERVSVLAMQAKRLLVDQVRSYRTDVETLTSKNVMKGPKWLLDERRLMLDSLTDRMITGISDKAGTERNRFVLCVKQLDAYSPLKVLSRGYSIAEGEKGIIKRTADVKKDDRLKLRLQDGYAACTVDEIYVSVVEG